MWLASVAATGWECGWWVLAGSPRGPAKLDTPARPPSDLANLIPRNGGHYNSHKLSTKVQQPFSAKKKNSVDINENNENCGAGRLTVRRKGGWCLRSKIKRAWIELLGAHLLKWRCNVWYDWWKDDIKRFLNAPSKDSINASIFYPSLQSCWILAGRREPAWKTTYWGSQKIIKNILAIKHYTVFILFC